MLRVNESIEQNIIEAIVIYIHNFGVVDINAIALRVTAPSS